MTRLLTGHGMLKTATDQLGMVEYKIQVSEPSNARAGSGVGTIWGSMDVIFSAFEAGDLKIVRDDGYEMGVVVVSSNADGSATVKTNGDPGI